MLDNDLPPRPPRGTGIPEAAWLDPGGGKYLHYYLPNANTLACGRWRSIPFTRAAWLRRETVTKPKCLYCLSSTTAGWVMGLHF